MFLTFKEPMSRESEGDALRKSYPPNSKVSKEKHVTSVVTSPATVRKAPLGRRLAKNFRSEEANSIWNYILFEVVFPAAKDLVYDAFTQGLQRSMYGSSAGRTTRGTGGRVAYNKIQPKEEPRRELSRQARASHNFTEVVIATRGEAELILERLGDLVGDFDVATVSDLYDLVGHTPKFTDERWGWVSLEGARIVRVQGGYILDLPKPEQLE